MIYIYNDYGGTHTTSLAAAYHLKKLPQSERKLTTEEILNVQYFNKLTHADFGKIIFHGMDEDGNPVYTIGRKRNKLVVPAGEEVVVRAELAGVEPKDVEIRFENGVLTLKGERKLEKEDSRENYHRLELSYGTFTRSFSLPATIDPEKIRAESKQGVLHIHLPKKAEAKPKSIQVKVS